MPAALLCLVLPFFCVQGARFGGVWTFRVLAVRVSWPRCYGNKGCALWQRRRSVKCKVLKPSSHMRTIRATVRQ